MYFYRDLDEEEEDEEVAEATVVEVAQSGKILKNDVSCVKAMFS
jgi:hypothetical protein